jgi:two-component system sensor histidine kinase QseC
MTPASRSRSLQTRLLVPLLGLLTVVWLGAVAVTWFDARHELDELLDSHLAQAAALLVMQQAGEHENESVEEAPLLHKYAPRVVFQVFHEDRLVMRSANAGGNPISETGLGFSTVRMDDGKLWRVFSATGAENDVRVYVGEQMAARNSILLAIMQGFLLPLLFALPLLALVGWWAVHQGLAPMRQLGSLLGQRRPQALEPLQISDLPSEMQPMVRALNALFERIEHMLMSERRFTADAAHELRTPIAGIRAQAQVAMGAGNDAGQRNHALQATLAGCDRATRLVEQLLTLARLEATSANPASAAVEVDLSAVARRVAADLAPNALARHQHLELLAATACPVAGDEMLISVLLRNLIDNAIRYSPDGSRIQVRVTCESEHTLLQVDDGGPGMIAPEIARLGERFFRVLGNEQPGSGLGWSIVKRIACVFGAEILVTRSALLGGLAVSVQWPPRQKA